MSQQFCHLASLISGSSPGGGSQRQSLGRYNCSQFWCHGLLLRNSFPVSHRKLHRTNVRKRYILLRAIWFWSFCRESYNKSSRGLFKSVPSADLSWTFFLQDSQVTEMPLTTTVTFVDITQKPEPPRGQPRTDWKLPFDFFFPFKVAFSKGADSQKGSVSPVHILCLLLLGILLA